MKKTAKVRRLFQDPVTPGGGGDAGRCRITLGAGIAKPMLGRYRIEEELGRGATGIVYLGSDTESGREIAIKAMALSPEFDADEVKQVRERFVREAAAAGRLRHPHVVTVFDAGEARGLAYIAMEYLKGKDLTSYIKPDNLLPLPQVMRIIARVAAALHYAHVNRVVHRDIKPSNILYDPASDTVKVTDFGIAQLADSPRTRTGRAPGTPAYMSPEQLTGKVVDGRSDLFSLGVTFYQLVAGHLPFRGDSLPQLVFNIANAPHVDILTYNPKLPACLAGVINKALTKHPAERCQTGDEMAQAIKACAAAMGGSRSQRKWRAAPRGAV